MRDPIRRDSQWCVRECKRCVELERRGTWLASDIGGGRAQERRRVEATTAEQRLDSVVMSRIRRVRRVPGSSPSHRHEFTLGQSAGVALIAGLAALFVFPWSVAPGQPRGLSVEVDISEPLDYVYVQVWDGPPFADLPAHQQSVRLTILTTPTSSVPSGGSARLRFEDGVSSVTCPGCTQEEKIAPEGVPTEYRWESLWITTPLLWEATSCSDQEAVEPCYRGEIEPITIETSQPLLVSAGSEVATVRLPSVEIEGADPASAVAVSLPLSTQFIVTSGLIPVAPAPIDVTLWRGTLEDFAVQQSSHAIKGSADRYGDARIFLAGILASVAVEGLLAVAAWALGRFRTGLVVEP